MHFFRVPRTRAAVPALFVLLLGLNSCGGGNSLPPLKPVSSPALKRTSSPTLTPSYSLAATAFTSASVTAGNTTTSTITVTPTGGYSGTITLSCSAMSGANAPACSFSPNPVPVSGAGTSTLTVSTSLNTPGGNYAFTVSAKDADHAAPTNGSQSLTLTASAVIQHVVVIFQENRTPDNLFQDSVLISRGADIVQQGKNSSGQTIALTPINLGTAGSTPQNYDLDHSHAGFVGMY